MAGDGRSRAAEAGDDAPVRDVLLADLVRRQPLLAAINIAAALLFASALLGAAPGPELVAWLAYVALAQAARLALWWRHAAGRPARDAAGWLVAASAAAGLGWGLIGLLFAGLGSAAQQALVPFFLAGMAGGAITALPGHPPAFYAFIVPALLPYAARLGLAAEPATHAMGLVTLLYAASIAAVGRQVHGLLRRSAELGSENAALIADLERARRDLERLAERRGAELEAVLATVPARSGSCTTRRRGASPAAGAPPRCWARPRGQPVADRARRRAAAALPRAQGRPRAAARGAAAAAGGARRHGPRRGAAGGVRRRQLPR